MKKAILFLFILISFSAFSQQITESDKNALIALYNATDGANWTNTWDLNDSPENWYGVVTNLVFTSLGPEIHVDEINLSDNNLKGNIPAEIGNLKDLEILDLSNNNLLGSIPPDLGNAEDISDLLLNNNRLSGDIPTELFTLNERHFVNIDLSHNQLTGTLPLEIGDAIANIGHVNVSNNLLNDLPDYSNITLFRIETLDISNNNIYFSTFERVSSFDPLVEVLESNVANLTYAPQNKIDQIEEVSVSEGSPIQLSTTNLAGSNNTYQWYKNNTLLDGQTGNTLQINTADIIDAGTYYCEIKNATVPNLTITRNDISLNITDVTVNDRNSLIALYNATDGPNWATTWDLTADMSTWSGVRMDNNNRVTRLRLNNNNLSGELPEEIWNLTELEELSLFFNGNLTGSIPISVNNLSKLKTLDLRFTQIGGNLPAEFFTLTSLESLELGFKFTGSLNGIENLTNLKSIISEGGFNNIPDSFWTLTNLVEITFTQISGNTETTYYIPESIDQMTQLERLSISAKNTRAIPENLTSLTNLKSLSLGYVSMGNIPNNIGNLVNLTSLSLSGGFEGNIPNTIGNLLNLNYLNLENNQLTGSIPGEIGNLTNLETLILRENQLEGTIPAELANLSNLATLFLSGNNLSGTLPSDIGNLTSITAISLNDNNFSGSIPESIQNLSSLNFFTIRDNNFVFEDLESNFDYLVNNINSFSYSPQSKLDAEEVIILNQGEETTLSIETTQSTNNIYQWRKDGVEIEGATERIYTISNSTTSDVGEYDCIITNSIVNDLTLYRNKIILDVTLGIEDFNSAGIKAYPVPTKDQLVLSLGAINGEHITASLYGMLGSKVFEQKNLTDNQILDFSNLQSGTYILKLQTNTKTYVSRILKQ